MLPKIRQNFFSMSSEEEPSGVRFTAVWSILYTVAILVAIFYAWQDRGLTAGQRNQAAAVALFLLIWHILADWVIFYRTAKDGRTPVKIAFPVMLVSIVGWSFLIQTSYAFYIAIFGLFSQLYSALPLAWAGLGSLLVLSGMVYEQTVGSGQPVGPGVIFVYLMLGAASFVLGAWINAIIKQSSERKELIDQLRATQEELAQSERRAGVLAERQRLAHEIHDTLAQGFISIIMNLETAVSLLPDTETDARHHVTQAAKMARHNLQQAREVVDDLRPQPLAQSATLIDAVQKVTRDWSAASGIAAETAVAGEWYPLNPAVEVGLLRATQEALANVRKHAQATAVQVTLTYLPDQIILDVQDNGIGLQNGTPSAHRGGYGLIAMRERITALQGQVALESEPNEGTTLMVSVPVREQG